MLDALPHNLYPDISWKLDIMARHSPAPSENASSQQQCSLSLDHLPRRPRITTSQLGRLMILCSSTTQQYPLCPGLETSRALGIGWGSFPLSLAPVHDEPAPTATPTFSGGPHDLEISSWTTVATPGSPWTLAAIQVSRGFQMETGMERLGCGLTVIR